jgi:competence ComEA-like helix-hairpin-helix protein
MYYNNIFYMRQSQGVQMMRNIEQLLLLCITVLCIGLMIGILIGRFGNTPAISLSEYDRIYDKMPTQTAPYADEHSGKININIASAEEIAMLPGIGITYANRIVEYRSKYGPFISIDEIKDIKGISENRYKAIKEYITVGGQS